MQEFERASLHKDFVNEENNTGSYIFEPLERGFGITIGNTICRTCGNVPPRIPLRRYRKECPLSQDNPAGRCS